MIEDISDFCEHYHLTLLYWRGIMNRKVLIIGLIVTITIILLITSHDDESGEIIEVKANNELGFSTNYYLYIPTGVNKDKVNYILVEPNNTGTTNDNHQVHEDDVIEKVNGGLSRQIANELKVPLLVPVFDRLESNWEMYTHALDRDTILNSEGYLERIGLRVYI